MLNLERTLSEQHSLIRPSLEPTRLTERRLFNHASIPIALVRFAALVRSQAVDIVHINIAPRGSTWRKMLFGQCARLLGVRQLLHLHGSGYDEWYAGLAGFRQRMVRAFFRSADAVVTMGTYWQRFAIETLEVPAERVHLISNGVADRPLADGAGVGEPPNLIFMGIVGKRKGVDVLLEALAEPALRALPWRAIIGGNGEVDAARRRADELGLTDRVEFTGWIGAEEVHSILCRGDVYVLPSRQENQPMSILEAMACGLPVVSTLIGAIPEQVIDGETGFLVPPGEAGALADALQRLLGDAELRKRLGRQGQMRQRALYSIEGGTAHFASLYRAIAGDAR
ncbi:glycosyltransferase family 4 protein [Sphingobium aromaticiconvertens]|uniref:glycosyltransferase family 4 protein n=1 Tax=Sphingobium aromaticiconvertens TaxID=365341 RepID=UPI0030168B55